MKETRILMGMPIEIEIVGNDTEVRRAIESALELAAASCALGEMCYSVAGGIRMGSEYFVLNV